jgi:hypothetical protein
VDAVVNAIRDLDHHGSCLGTRPRRTVRAALL